MGSNTSPRIVQYFEPCLRGDTDIRLNLKGGNWCSAFACYCMQQALKPGEKEPHGYRAGVVELVADVSRPDRLYSGTWHSVATARSGEFRPEPGDLAIYDRSIRDLPGTAWWRHVNRVVEHQGGTYLAIGGNETDAVRVARHDMEEPRLLGFISYPRVSIQDLKPVSQPPSQIFTETERQEIWNNVALFLDEMIRRKLYK